MWTRSESADEELVANVQSLRDQLRRTEKNLQSLGEELSSTSEYSDNCFDETANLTLEDLVQPNCNYQCSSNCKKIAGRTSCQDFQRKSESELTPITYDKSVEENERLREKLNDLREQNASVASQNHYLKNKAETMNLELMQLKTKISYLESTLGTRLVSIPKLEERIVNLEAEISAQDKILRDTEDKLEQSQKTIMERESMLHRYKKDYKNLKMELIERSKQGERGLGILMEKRNYLKLLIWLFVLFPITG